jgi:hypothetical protein
MSQLEDDLAIRTLVARYADAVNRYNEADWAATWGENATWHLMGMPVTSRQAIVDLWRGAMSTFDFALMMMNSGTLEIDGDTATGRWYLTEHTKPTEGDAAVVLGVYDDKYCKENGAWVFAERRYNIMYQGPADYSGNYQPYR